MLSFTRSKGAYAGISLEGSVVPPDSAGNEAFYGRSVTPVDILVRQNVDARGTGPLRASLARMSR